MNTQRVAMPPNFNFNTDTMHKIHQYTGDAGEKTFRYRPPNSRFGSWPKATIGESTSEELSKLDFSATSKRL